MIKKISISVFVMLGLFFAGNVFAADFKLSPSAGTYGEGKQFTVDLKINTFGESINAAQGKIQFDSDVVQVESLSKDGSVFNFWLQEPTYSNADGTIEFIGGTPNGVSGSALQIVSVTFSATSLGSSDLLFIEASITASDGTGTDIFGNASGATYSVSSGGGGILPDAPSDATPVPTAVPVPTPVQITRKATIATGLPDKPEIEIQLYPNPDSWYNLVSQFTASWDLPSDISELNTELNKNPNYDVPKNSEGLFDSKAFESIEKDGVYYLHIRFKNNIGWGPTGHYRIAIDTQPPLAFDIEVPSGKSSDNPSPTLLFNTGDSLSGIDSFDIFINQENPISISTSQEGVKETTPRVKVLETGLDFLNVRSEPSVLGELLKRVDPGDEFDFVTEETDWYQIVIQEENDSPTMGWVFGRYVEEIESIDSVSSIKSEYSIPPHPPGEYLIRVLANDRAGNSIEARSMVEILPIEAPFITSIAEIITRGTDDIFRLKGTALPDTFVVVDVEDKDQFLVVQTEVLTDENGQWIFELDRELRRGSYFVTTVAKDKRGALSYPTETLVFKVKDKPIISLFGLNITMRGLIILLVSIIVIAATVVWRRAVMRQVRMSREAIVINRDLKNAFNMVRKDLDMMSVAVQEKKNAWKQRNMVYESGLKKIQGKLNSVQKYVGEDIENLEHK